LGEGKESFHSGMFGMSFLVCFAFIEGKAFFFVKGSVGKAFFLLGKHKEGFLKNT
jgi:hypothetical protein